MADYKKFLADSIIAEDKVVTYRLLSRSLKVHVNTAKQMLYEFHKYQNDRRPGAVFATYLVYGVKNHADQQNGTDGDVEMTSSMPETRSVDELIPTFTLSLVPEDRLKDVLSQYDEVSSIHVYSVGPGPIKDLALLADPAITGFGLDMDEANKLSPISNPYVRRRERRGAGAIAAAAASKPTKPEAKPVTTKPGTVPVKGKEQPKDAEPSPAPEKASSAPSKKPPALKRGGSSNSGIMQAFSKAAAAGKIRKEKTSQPATPSGDDSSMHPMSDDGEDDEELPQPKPRQTAGRKTKKEREEELRRMMEEMDDDEDEEEKAPTPEPEPEEEPPAPEPAKEEPAEVVTTSGDGRRRGKRKVMRKKQIMDEQGYLGMYLVWDGSEKPLVGESHEFDPDACPDYTHYAAYPHRPLSKGPLGLPFQRPDRRCRTFHSNAIEKVISDVTSRMKDPDLARLFENAFPSTTDTTVRFHTDGKDGKGRKLTRNRWSINTEEGEWEGPQSFIITGDILAEWLRDSTNQLSPYQALATKDPRIFNLILGAINTQSEYVIDSPYCNAFQPPPISGLPVTLNGQDDNVHPAFEPTFVFECKYELDSLGHFLALANDFYEHTKSTKFMNKRWYRALDTLLGVLGEQSQSTFDPETSQFLSNEYTFQRRTNTGTETLNLNGIGNPLNNGTGLIRSAFRPSDDATIFGFFIPANAMMATELKRTAAILRSTEKKSDDHLAETLEDWSRNITKGIWEYGVVPHRKYGDVFAYEVDGYGSSLIMDDANYPSLLALPLMGFVKEDDPIYRNTRKMLLEKESNPYYLQGREFKGIGGPHIGLQNAWPMSLLMQARTTDDDDEIEECLQLILKASGLGLIHESVDVNFPSAYTRSWFAWANGVFAETILDLAKRKPHLIFKDARPYEL
ncbi:hypothetical protein QBC47DRAFT_323046 [Echria macrotheca]|uniref:DNA polymerase delta subunit 3 n=1 Tax=Echria macrotheca TaxID=438768 RepID=A0AAJ0BCW1_9PEZI|nr:hypothetical protein QBC47DRAFT_323046 [Echria macrotheca]